MSETTGALFALDSTKLQDYMMCPRYAFFRHCYGWRSRYPSLDLTFGTSWHIAMEYLLLNGYSVESALIAGELFDKEFKNSFPEDTDEMKAKTSANALTALFEYIKTYQDDKFEVLATEVAGTIHLAEGKLLYFRLDSLINGEIEGLSGYFSLEHKTASRNDTKWRNSFLQKTQVGTYCHALYCLFEKNEVLGTVINRTCFKKGGNEFQRALIQKTPQRMMDWQATTLYWFNQYQRDLETILKPETKGESILKAFPKNTESCTAYYGCPFLDFCMAWLNPLQHAEEQQEFRIEYWDPRQFLETCKKKVEL